MFESWRHRVLGKWSDLICLNPRLVLLAAALLATAAVVFTAMRLEFQSNRNELISEDLPWNQWFIDWQDNFPGAADLVVVIDIQPPPGNPPLTPQRQAQAQRLVDALGPALAADPYVEHAVWGFDPRQVSAAAVQLLPPEAFEQRMNELAQSQPLLAAPTPGALVANVVHEMRAGGHDLSEEQALEGMLQLRQLIANLGRAITTPVDEPIDVQSLLGDNDADPAADQWQYLVSESGRLYFITISPRMDHGALNAVEPAVESIRRTVDRLAADYPDLEAGLTGIEAVEADETRAATRDSTRSSIVAVVLITIVLILAFHSVRMPLLAMAALLTGIAWAFGFLTLTIGYLQVLSVVFAVILLGLGIEYGILLASNFERHRHEHGDDSRGFLRAMRQTVQTMGPGIVTGAVTTAAAFMTTLFTDFTGVAEMGWIAGWGVLLCLLAMGSVFLALLRLFASRHPDLTPLGRRWIHLFEERWVLPFTRWPRITASVGLLLTVVSVFIAVTQMRFDFDLMKLQAQGVQSVELADRISQDGERSIWVGVSVAADMDEARRRVELLRQYRAAMPDGRQPTFGSDFGGVGMLVPERQQEKLARMRQVRESLGALLEAALAERDVPSEAPDVLEQLSSLRRMFGMAWLTSIPDAVRDAMRQVQTEIDAVLEATKALSGEERTARLERLEFAYAQARRGYVAQIDQSLDPRPLELEDFPADLMRSYRDKEGRVVLLVYPQLPPPETGITSALDPRFLPHFVHDVEQVDPQITGVAAQVYRSGDLIRKAYVQAGACALVIVFILVLLDFRSVIDALMCLLPVAVGFAVTFAVMWLLGMQVNAANIIVLPLMFGIGVDSGVHVLHRYRQSPEADPPGLTDGTGKGITVTALCTMIGFGSMLLADHRGIWSLGFVMTLGIGMTLLACWTVLPALLVLRRRWQRPRPQ